jgi:hypothetical protein
LAVTLIVSLLFVCYIYSKEAKLTGLGVAGGRYGLYDIPQFMFHKLEGVSYLEDLSSRFAEFVVRQAAK